MDPIDLRADTTFTQALRCVQYRLPRSTGLKAPGYVLALGIRYGMIGIAASHHLLITALDDEESRILQMIEAWPNLVEDHVRWDLADRLPHPVSSGTPNVIAAVSALPIRAYLPLFGRMCPLTRALDLIGENLIAEHRAMVIEGWPWFRRKIAARLLAASVAESTEFALHFFERRQADCEEVPEIALIGE